MEKVRVYSVGLCLSLLSVLYAACTGKAPEYPDLEGYWKMERVVDNLTGEDLPCERLFWALQLQVIELRDLGENSVGTAVGRFEYDKGKGTLRLYHLVSKGSQSKPAGEKLLTKFGIPSTDTTFEVISLDGKQMVLHTEETTFYLRSF